MVYSYTTKALSACYNVFFYHYYAFRNHLQLGRWPRFQAQFSKIWLVFFLNFAAYWGSSTITPHSLFDLEVFSQEFLSNLHVHSKWLKIVVETINNFTNNIASYSSFIYAYFWYIGLEITNQYNGFQPSFSWWAGVIINPHSPVQLEFSSKSLESQYKP